MTISRRSTIKTIGVVGTGSALTGTVLGVNEHEDDERDPESVPDDEETGAIRVAHFSPDAPNVDVYVNDQRILADVAYEDVSPYLEIVPGTYSLTITAAGEPDEIVYRQQFAVEDGYYTAAAVGELGDGADALESDDENDRDNRDDEENLDAESDDLESDDQDGEDHDDHDDHDADDRDEAPETDEGDALDAGSFDVLLLADRTQEEVEQRVEGADAGQVRVVHASPNAPAVDVNDSDAYVTIFENVEFTTPSGYAAVEEGTITLDVYPAGDAPTPDDKPDPGLEPEGEADADETIAPDDDDEADEEAEDADHPEPVGSVEIDVEAGQAYTAYAIGYLDSQAEQAERAEQSDQAADEAADEQPADEAADEAADEQPADEAADEQPADEAADEQPADEAADEQPADETPGDTAREDAQDRPEFDIVTLVDATTEEDDEVEDDADYDADDEVDEEPMEAEQDDHEDDADHDADAEDESDSADEDDTETGDDRNETDGDDY